MAYTQTQRSEILERIAATGKKKIVSAIPDECRAYRELAQICTIDREFDGFPYKINLIKAKNCRQGCPVYINVHGGGFIGPHTEKDILLSCYIADGIEGIVADIDYSTSDIAPYPLALNQCYDAAEYVFEHCGQWGGDVKCISMGGYSAGGSLTAGVAMRAAMEKSFSLCMQALIYPPVDMLLNPLLKNDGYERAIPYEREMAFYDLYLNDEESFKTDPCLSPLLASDDMLEKLPRTLIISAEKCNFRWEDEEYAWRLAGLGVEVVVKRFSDSGHGFVGQFTGRWKEADELLIRTIRQADDER